MKAQDKIEKQKKVSGFFKCPKCNREWNMIEKPACKCGATLKTMVYG